MTPLHLLFLFSALPAIGYGDYLGLQWMRGKRRLLDAALMRRIHTWVYVCLFGIIGTGIFMVVQRASLLNEPVFFVKMAFVSALVLNGIFMGTHARLATSNAYAALDARQRRVIFISGAVSAISWIGAILGGLAIG